jgi:hypothetical protein
MVILAWMDKERVTRLKSLTRARGGNGRKAEA